ADRQSKDEDGFGRRRRSSAGGSMTNDAPKQANSERAEHSGLADGARRQPFVEWRAAAVEAKRAYGRGQENSLGAHADRRHDLFHQAPEHVLVAMRLELE